MDKLINLAKQFILSPKEAWESVKDDTSTAQQHVTSYVFPLALIPAIATFIGFGFIGYIHSIEWGISSAVMSLINTLLGVFISGFVIHKLAPSFQTEVSLDKAVKLVGFSYTAALVGGIFNIYTPLAILVFIAAIYSLYVLYLGFKPMTNVSEEKSVGYFVVSLVVIILVYVVIGIVLTALFGAIGFATMKGSFTM
ncbi:MAG: YIP1 family protein [Flavobacteriaceae bacterium]|nr:YIP1 family protein [Flavobacteriaceae bacterium]